MNQRVSERNGPGLPLLHRLIPPLAGDVHIRRPNDAPILEVQLFQPMRAPADDSRHRENRRIQLQGDADHLVNEARVEVEVGADGAAAAVDAGDAVQAALFDELEEVELPLEAFFGRQRRGHPLQRHRARVAQRVDRVAESVDEAGAVVRLAAQHPHQVLVDFGRVLPILDLAPQVAEHIGDHHIGAAVQATFQGADPRGDGRVDVRLRGARHAHGEGRVVTAAVLGLRNHQQVKHSRFHRRVVAAEHPEEVFGQ